MRFGRTLTLELTLTIIFNISKSSTLPASVVIQSLLQIITMLTVILCSTYLPSLGNGRILFEFSEVRYCRFIKYFLFFSRSSRSPCLVCPRSSESLIVFSVSGLLVDLGFMIKKCCSPKPRPRRISSSRELSNQKVVKAQDGEQVTTQWRRRS